MYNGVKAMIKRELELKSENEKELVVGNHLTNPR